MRHGYHRPAVMRVVWGAGITLALLAALIWAGVLTLRAARADERRVVLQEGNILLTAALERGDTLRRSLDSLSAIVRQRDTLLIVRIEQAKGEAEKPMPPASDTAALVGAVRSCRATLDTLATECTAFREAATRALATADSVRRADSLAMAAQSVLTAGITRSRDAALAQLASRGTRRAFERGICLGSLATNYLQWRSR